MIWKNVRSDWHRTYMGHERKFNMQIRRAEKKDMDGINKLLNQVLMVHHNGRPDLFKANVKKYNDDQLLEIIADDERPIFVGLDENEQVMGYAFCVFEHHKDDNILTPIKTLYIDDLCVDAAARGKHVGESLYHYVKDYARANGFYHVTLNVWSFNEKAIGFYEAMGLKPMEYVMEEVLK